MEPKIKSSPYVDDALLMQVLVGFGCLTIVAFTLIIIFHKGDNAVILTALTTTSSLIITQLLTFKKTIEAKQEATASRLQSEENAIATASVHEIVNSQRTAMEAKIDDLQKALAEMKQVGVIEKFKSAILEHKLDDERDKK
jgi:hypothetical protein